MIDHFKLVTGISDHTLDNTTSIAAVSLGASIIEKHFTDDNSRVGPDHRFAMNPKTWKEMILRSRELERSLGSKTKKIELNEKDTVVVQRRSIHANKLLKKNHIIKKKRSNIFKTVPKARN